MFLIVDNTKRKMRNEAKLKFNSFNIPCVICDLEHCDAYFPAAIVIVTESYLMKDVEYISSFYERSPIILWDDTVNLFDFAISAYKEIYNVDLFDANRMGLSIKENEFYYRRFKIHLTNTEFKIMRYIFFYDGWHSRELIARYCLKRGFRDRNAVPVHISNINHRLRRIAHGNIIKSKRNIGYCI